MITWHYDHCSGKCVKGVNFLSSFYYGPRYEMGFPIGVEYVVKDIEYKDGKGKTKRKSGVTKNGMVRRMVRHADFNVGLQRIG
ncbi:hypothetical protein [Flagellimonas aequoris]|uniref:Uncharacterized protein n=1 Tax=Flagellimonas aequoris TaxID=2306997 RepID=A0ABY3KQW5_9FLAO|nr:hypothetical protein [Allomuricauda aequoris]TXK00698.1 hypothetical protein FQ019_17465 [Allomuricauda aequoris]